MDEGGREAGCGRGRKRDRKWKRGEGIEVGAIKGKEGKGEGVG